jgi:hypothetical protein
LNITPSALLSDVINADDRLQAHIDGFDVLFGKGASTSLVKLEEHQHRARSTISSR